MFGFDASELIWKGRPRFVDLSNQLSHDVIRSEVRVITSYTCPCLHGKLFHNTVFLAHSLAGWVVKQALGDHRTLTSHNFRVREVIFIQLPSITGGWDDYQKRLLQDFHVKRAREGGLDIKSLKVADANFQLLVNSDQVNFLGKDLEDEKDPKKVSMMQRSIFSFYLQYQPI